MKTFRFFTGASLLASSLAAISCAATAHAQTTTSPATAQANGEEVDPDEIVVTAQKKNERLLDVPVAVTALPSEALARQNLVRITDFATRVPGLSVSASNVFGVTIRGINAAPTSPTVATIIDDLPFGTTSWSGAIALPDLDPSDLQQIEVLRGPQGTLYGASSLGGLIKYVTKNADATKFSGRVEGDYNVTAGGSPGYGARGALNVPIVEDMLAVRISGFKRWDTRLGDRFARSAANPPVRTLLAENVNDSIFSGFRGSVFFQPTSSLSIAVSHMRQFNDFTNSSTTIINRAEPLYTPTYGYFGNDSASSVGQNRTVQTQGRVVFDAGFATLTSVTGWSEMRSTLDSDSTRGFSFVLGAYPGQPAGTQVRLTDNRTTSKFTQEVRLASSGSGPLEWLLGGFYTNERNNLFQEIFVQSPTGSRVDSVVIFPLPSQYREYAGFADLTYHFSDNFQVQVGGRYSKNKQSYTDQQITSAAGATIFGPSRLGATSHSEDDSFTWLITPSYKVTSDIMLFARVATGYRPGGPNTAAAPANNKTFSPDRVTNYELGVKGRFLDRMLTIDTSVFNIDWKDIQLSAVSATSIPFFINGGRARSRGWEGAVELAPGSGWTFTGNFTVLDAVLKDPLPAPATGASGIVGAAGDPLPYSAKFSGNLGFNKKFQLGDDWSFDMGANYTHIGERDTDFRSTLAPAARAGKLRVPAYDLVDARVGLQYRGIDATFYVRNLFNERGLISAGDTQGQSSTLSATFIRPRSAGINVSYAF